MATPAAAVSPTVDPADPTIVDPVLVTDPAVTEPIDANAAAPSTVDVVDAKEPPSLLSVIKSAVEKPAEAVVSSDPEGDPVDPAAADPAVVAEPAAEDDANLPFHQHPRWKAVIAERDSLKEPAERFGYIQGFMQEHGLSVEEVADGYEIMALLKSGDPDKLAQARDALFSRIESIDAALGNVLPPDLQARIDEGLLDEEGAAELSRARAATALRTATETTRAAAEAEAAKERDTTAATQAIVSAVEAWEARIKASDVDYPMKADLVQAKCQAIVMRTGIPPKNAVEATALAEQALGEVNAMLKATRPKPRAIVPAPAGTSTIATAEPKTLREVVAAAAGR